MTTAAKAPKAPNYTPEQTTKMVRDYIAAGKTPESVATIAAELGRTVRSIVAKLSREKDPATGESVYKAKEYQTKTGAKPEKKDTTADAIGAVLRLTEAETESLTKANKTALQKIWKALATSKPISADDTPALANGLDVGGEAAAVTAGARGSLGEEVGDNLDEGDDTLE